MSINSITVEAFYENGVLRLTQPLPLAPRQRVTVTVQLDNDSDSWPDNTAAIYQEIAEDDRRLAETMFTSVRETWPLDKEGS